MKNQKKHILFPFFLALCLILVTAGTVSAAPVYKNKFVKTKGKIYHYNEKGKKDKGIIKINGKNYYFDSKGIQRTGWQKIKNNYYFFQVKNGRGGSMVTSKTVNGIKLGRNGKASYNSTGLRKLKVMVKANKIMESVTHYDMTKSQKLRKCFDKLLTYRYCNIGDFRKWDPNWDIFYAEEMLFKGRGDCYCGGSAFAYLANAVGYTNAASISSGGHGWAEVNSRICDPNWAVITQKPDDYFYLEASMSGVGGRPMYSQNRWYVKKV